MQNALVPYISCFSYEFYIKEFELEFLLMLGILSSTNSDKNVHSRIYNYCLCPYPIARVQIMRPKNG